MKILEKIKLESSFHISCMSPKGRKSFSFFMLLGEKKGKFIFLAQTTTSVVDRERDKNDVKIAK